MQISLDHKYNATLLSISKKRWTQLLVHACMLLRKVALLSNVAMFFSKIISHVYQKWPFAAHKAEMRSAVAQLDKYFNMSSNRPFLTSSNDSSRSGSFCSDAESLPSSSPPRESFCTSPNDDPSNLRLPIFSRFAWPVVTNGNRESAKSQLIFKTNTENVCVQSWHSTLVEAERGLCGIYRSESMMWSYTCSLSEQSWEMMW